MVMLNAVCAFAICREMTSISGPLGEIIWITYANGLISQMKIRQPEILKVQCAKAVRFASLDCPIQASSAVMVVPILVPRIMEIA